MTGAETGSVSYADLAHRCGMLSEELRRVRRALREITGLPCPATPKDYQERGGDAFSADAKTLIDAQNIARRALQGS